MEKPACRGDAMTRVRLVLLSTIAAGAVAIGAAQEPQFRAGAHSVSIYATVVDEAGRLVPDLARDDFQVFDNGVRQDLSVFANDIQPITIVIMLDRSGSMMWNFELVQQAAEEFIGDLLPADKARVGSFSNRIEIDPETFTTDRAALLDALRQNLQDGGPTPLWNATAAAMNALGSQSGRRVVLLFTDGKDAPPNPTGNASVYEIRSRSEREEIMVYAIGLARGCGPVATASRSHSTSGLVAQRGGPPRGPIFRFPFPRGPIVMPPVGMPRIDPPRGLPPRIPAPDPADTGSGCAPSRPDPGLADVASVGGGSYFELRSTDDLKATFKRVAEELHRQYLLAFRPAKLDGSVHTLEVRLTKPGLTARARRGYVAAPDR
jgi:VWFA-related protein